MTDETADRWLDSTELEWVEDDPSVDALLRDVCFADPAEKLSREERGLLLLFDNEE
jgi:hypothetical protein